MADKETERFIDCVMGCIVTIKNPSTDVYLDRCVLSLDTEKAISKSFVFLGFDQVSKTLNNQSYTPMFRG